MNASADIVICGAGIAGVSTAYFLARQPGFRDILLIDRGDPLSLTSDKSSECYRNWWPGPGEAMVALMNRSIDLLEGLATESGNTFQLSRRGYLYLTADPGKVPAMTQQAEAIAALGAGPLRIHIGSPHDPPYPPQLLDGYDPRLAGADLILDPEVLRRQFPYVTRRAVAALHARRAGWFSGQQLGTYLIQQGKARGVRQVQGNVGEVEVRSNRVRAVRLENGLRIETPVFVNAAGPLLRPVGGLLGVDLPVFNELHLKSAFRDPLQVLPRQAPLLVWDDPLALPWSEEERQELEDDPELSWMLGKLPAGVHARPEGGPEANIALMLWDYHRQVSEAVWPLPLDPYYAEVVLRGLAAILPGLSAYFQAPGRPVVDGGYYTRTVENRPLIGPLPVEGAYVIGALSGFGLMAAPACGELLAAYLAGTGLPGYAAAFRLERYQDPDYLHAFSSQGDSGQL